MSESLKSCKFEQFIFFERSEGGDIKCTINNDIIQKYLANFQVVRFITFGGDLSNDSEYLISSIPYFYKHNDYTGLLENSFNVRVDSVKGVQILLDNLSTNDNIGIFLLVVEPIKDSVEGDVIKDQVYNKMLDDIYILLLLFSDAFVFEMNENNDSVTNTKISNKFNQICQTIKNKNNSDKIFDNLYVFNTNNKELNLLSKNYIKDFSGKKFLNEWIFPIGPIPNEFKNEMFTKYIKESNFEKSLKIGFDKILKNIEHSHKVKLNRLKLDINYLNNKDTDPVNEIIILEMHLTELEARKLTRLKILDEVYLVLNRYNFQLYEYEIAEEVSKEYIEEEISKLNKDDFFRVLLEEMRNMDNGQKAGNASTYANKLDILPQELGEALPQIGTESDGTNPNDMVASDNSVSAGGGKRLKVTLKNGEKYIVSEPNTAASNEETTTSGKRFGKENNTKTMEEDIDDNNIEEYENTKGKNSEKEDPLGLGLNEKLGLTALSVGSAICGAILANLITGEYKRASWYNIKKDILISSGISFALSTMTSKLPWLGLAAAFGMFGIDSLSLVRNKTYTLKSKEELITKGAVQVVIGLGIGSGCTYMGASIGSVLPGVGTAVGTITGLLVGSLSGGFAATFVGNEINKIWKVLNPDDIVKTLKQHFIKDGNCWIDIEPICYELNLNKEFLLSNKPPTLANVNLESSDLVWANFILFNILTIAASMKENVEVEIQDMYNGVIKYLKNNEDHSKVYFYKFLPNVKKVLENWISLIK
jgi:uncharacterized protein YcfJ